MFRNVLVVVLAMSLGSTTSHVMASSQPETTNLTPVPFDETKTIVTAHVITCGGWTLNKQPVLKNFLKQGEAETFQGLSIEYIPGT